MKLLINIYFLRYGFNDYPKSFDLIYSHFSKFKKLKTNFFIVDNKTNNFVKKPFKKNIKFIKGDNSFLEFSALDKILKKIKKNQDKSNISILVNSSYFKNYSGSKETFLKFINLKTLIKFNKLKKTVSGRIDYYHRGLVVNDYKFFTWMRASFLIFRTEDLKFIKSFNSYGNKNISYKNVYKQYKINNTYKNFINSWLNKKQLAKNLPGNWDTNFKYKNKKKLKKILSIINEHIFSINIRKNNFQLMDLVCLNKNILNLSEKKQHLFRLKVKPDLY